MQKYLNDLLATIVLSLLVASKDRLTDSDYELIATHIKDKNLNKVFSLLESRYSSEELKKTIEGVAGPVIDSYFKEVIKA